MPGKSKPSTHQPWTVESSTEHVIHSGHSQLRIRVHPAQDTNIRLLLESLPEAPQPPLQPAPQPALTPARQAVSPSPAPVVVPVQPLEVGPQLQLTPWLKTMGGRLRPLWNLEILLLVLAVAIYLVTRLVGLEKFPIYFFTDEAVQTVLAGDLVRDGFNSPTGEFLPTYFVNGYQYNLSTSVYLQLIPDLLLPRSVFATRATSVLVTLVGAICVGLTLKNVFKLPHAWVATLLLSITPAWFLHSRTAFETALATSFFSGFIYFYLMYRTSSPRSLYGAVVMGALVFYSYSPARAVIGVAALLLFISDIGYHWRNRKTVLIALGVTAVLAVPFIRFLIIHPDESVHHLRILNSYWIQDISLAEKIGKYAIEYLKGLNPMYWYWPNSFDMARHKMKDYGHELLVTFPFLLLGIGLAFRHIKKSHYRALLLCLLAAPAGAALVEVGITRSLATVIPLALLTALGVVWLLQFIEKRFNVPRLILVLPIFALLAATNLYMLRDALTNGPTWYNDYGLGGMQYGGKLLFTTVGEYARQHPGTRIVVSPSWANGTDTIARFFYPKDDMPFEMGSIEGWFDYRQPLTTSDVFVMIPEEYDRMLASNKFTDVVVEKTIPYPDGTPGFRFVHLRYVDNIDEILAKEEAARKVLQTAEVEISGQKASIQYSLLDMGPVENMFDGDLFTLVRTQEANPLTLIAQFAQPRDLTGIDVHIGGVPSKVSIWLLDASGNQIYATSQSVEGDPNPRTVKLDFDKTYQASGFRLELLSINDSEPAHIHLWEVMLR
jgi:hypothetical protein